MKQQGAVQAEKGEQAGEVPNPAATPQAVETTPTAKTPDPELERFKAEASTYKGRYEATLKEVKAAKAELDRINQAKEDAILDEATADQPEKVKTDLKTFKDKLRAERQRLNEDLAAHGPILEAIKSLGITDGATLIERIKQAEALDYETAIYTTAEKNGVDAGVLKDQAEKLGLKDKAKIEELAAILPKKAAPIKVDSGTSVGGGLDLDKLTPREKIDKGLEDARKK